MKFLVILAALLAMAAGSPAQHTGARALTQFGKMITCSTGKGFLALLGSYNGYGCYCGFGGEGDAVDPTDQCCKDHDACYEASANVCWGLQKYTANYKYTSARQDSSDPSTCQITCKTADEYSFLDLNEDCKAWICECDRQAALCFGKHQNTYDDKYEGWSQCG